MKVLIFSDSHGNLGNMVSMVEKLRPDLILHLGDGWRDAEELRHAYPDIPLEQVPGNCDACAGGPVERVLTLQGRRIFFCHGHTLAVKAGLGPLLRRAEELEADVALFGHTHQPDRGQVGQMLWMNPGSVGSWRPSCGLLELEADGTIRDRLLPVK